MNNIKILDLVSFFTDLGTYMGSILSYPAGSLSDKWGRKKVLVAGYLLYGAVYLGFAAIPSPGWI
jgi:MFS family permease